MGEKWDDRKEQGEEKRKKPKKGNRENGGETARTLSDGKPIRTVSSSVVA